MVNPSPAAKPNPPWVLMPLAAALLAVGGCAADPLTMNLLATSELRSMEYRLDPAGRLTVVEGSGMVEGRPDQTLYAARLDEPDMRRMKKVIAGSGFMLRGPPTGPAAAGPLLRLEVKLGLWHNVVRARPAELKCVRTIVAEMNRHLPGRLKIECDRPTAAEERKAYEEYFPR